MGGGGCLGVDKPLLIIGVTVEGVAFSECSCTSTLLTDTTMQWSRMGESVGGRESILRCHMILLDH